MNGKLFSNTIFLLLLTASLSANAFTTLPGIQISTTSINIGGLFSSFSAPIDEFINIGKQIGENFSKDMPRVNKLSSNELFQGLNNWFLKTTGGTGGITQVFMFFKGIIIRIYLFILYVIQRGVALL